MVQRTVARGVVQRAAARGVVQRALRFGDAAARRVGGAAHPKRCDVALQGKRGRGVQEQKRRKRGV
jgi:hypothetical protein